MDYPYIVHSKDGTGYFQDRHTNWCMAPKKLDGSYDWGCVSYVDDMRSNGVGEKEIWKVKQFVASLESFSHLLINPKTGEV